MSDTTIPPAGGTLSITITYVAGSVPAGGLQTETYSQCTDPVISGGVMTFEGKKAGDDKVKKHVKNWSHVLSVTIE